MGNTQKWKCCKCNGIFQGPVMAEYPLGATILAPCNLCSAYMTLSNPPLVGPPVPPFSLWRWLRNKMS